LLGKEEILSRSGREWWVKRSTKKESEGQPHNIHTGKTRKGGDFLGKVGGWVSGCAGAVFSLLPGKRVIGIQRDRGEHLLHSRFGCLPCPGAAN